MNDRRIDLQAALACAREIYGPPFSPQLTLKAPSFSVTGIVIACRTTWRIDCRGS
ncbi:MAG TPA: hypothetical protein VII39_01320 [Bradyrhizobium sp.]